MLKHEALRLLREAIGEHGLTELRKRLNLAGGAPAVDVFLSGLVERVLSTQKALQPPTPAVAVAKAVVQTRAPAVPPLASGQATVRTGP